MKTANKKNRLKQQTEITLSPNLLKHAVVTGLCMGFVISAYLFVNAFVLPIQSLYVTGNISHMDKAELKRTVKNEIDTGFFAVDVDSIKAAVQQLAWVQSVSVRRVWPDSLHIEITEHVAVARWGKEHLINQRGHLFKLSSIKDKVSTSDNLAADVDLSSLPIITGPEGMYSKLFVHFQEMQTIIDKTGLSVKKIAVDARRSMRVTLMNDIVLLLGRVVEETNDYQELERFVSAYNKTLLQQAADIREVDLRYTNGFAVQWKSKNLASTADMAGFQFLRA